jgi:hypothetical protein
MPLRVVNSTSATLKHLALAVPLAAALWLGAGPSAQAIPSDALIHYTFDTGSISGATVTQHCNIAENTPDAATDDIVITVPAAKAAGGKLFERLHATLP